MAVGAADCLAGQYQVVDLGARTAANSINNNTQICGWSGGSVQRALYWETTPAHTPSVSMSTLPLLPGAAPSAYGIARRINQNGYIIGYTDDQVGLRRQVSWSPLHQVTPLSTSLLNPFTGGNDSAGINDTNQVTGSQNGSDPYVGASLSGPFSSPLASDWTLVYGSGSGINNNGESTGHAGGNSGTYHAYHFDGATSTVTLLGSPTAGGQLFGGTSYGSDINDRGVITGFSNAQIGAPYSAFLWDTRSGASPSVIYLTPTSIVSNAYDLNELSQVVGSYADPSLGSRAFRYDPASQAHPTAGGRLIDLNTMIAPGHGTGWVLQSATGINDMGEIVGSGLLNGVQHSYLLLPVPAPGSCVLALSAMCLVAPRRRR
jgi:hypothetical protein